MHCQHYVKELVIIIPLHYRIDNMAYQHNSAKLPHLLMQKNLSLSTVNIHVTLWQTRLDRSIFSLWLIVFYRSQFTRFYTLQLLYNRIRQKLKTAFFLKLTTAAQILLKKESASTNVPAERYSPSLSNRRLHKSTETFLKTAEEGLYFMLSFCRNDGDSHRSHPNRASR